LGGIIKNIIHENPFFNTSITYGTGDSGGIGTVLRIWPKGLL
jgi:hypothetical protein